MVWAARDDGALLAFVWEEEQSVWGWTICPLAGDGKVRSLCSVKEGGENRVYAIMERTIAGEVRLTRERMASARTVKPATDTSDRPDFHWECHLDCAVTRLYDEPTAEIDGLWHLEGETVAVFADGLAFDTDTGLVVTNGRITLPEGYECTLVHVGLPFDAIAETLPIDFKTPVGSSQGRKQQSGPAVVQLVNSRAPRVGVTEAKVRPVKSPNTHADLTSAESLLSGKYPIQTDPVVRLDTTVVVKQRIAPLTVTAIFIDVEATGD
jgi:hypothetical protein